MSPIDQLTKHLAKLPGLGSRSAKRVVLHLLKHKDTLMKPLAESIIHTMEHIQECPECGNLDDQTPCVICVDSRRDRTSICVVEEVADLWAMERSNVFRGTYHVLGGTLSALDGIGPDDLRISQLVSRAASEEVQEIILAMNATVDGQTTAHYISDRLKEANVKISRLAHGMPIGGELDYLDDGTLKAALAARAVI